MTVGWVRHGNPRTMVRCANRSKTTISVFRGPTSCGTHHLPSGSLHAPYKVWRRDASSSRPWWESIPTFFPKACCWILRTSSICSAAKRRWSSGSRPSCTPKAGSFAPPWPARPGRHGHWRPGNGLPGTCSLLPAPCSLLPAPRSSPGGPSPAGTDRGVAACPGRLADRRIAGLAAARAFFAVRAGVAGLPGPRDGPAPRTAAGLGSAAAIRGLLVGRRNK